MLHTLPFLLPALLGLEVEPGRAIVPSAPWAVAPEGPRSYLERVSGERIDPRDVPPVRDGNLVFDAEGMSVDMLAALDIPPSAALDHDPTPGVLYLAMDGVQIKPTCGGPQVANAALNCSPLVDQVVDFPPLAVATRVPSGEKLASSTPEPCPVRVSRRQEESSSNWLSFASSTSLPTKGNV